MSEKIFETEKPQTYCFEFGSDERIHTVSFKGKLSDEDTGKILEAAGKETYERAGEAIRSYLESEHLEYSDFESKETSLKHDKVMEWADTLLRSDACNKIDTWIGDADHYYAVMDHQKRVSESRYEGCYYAVKRRVSHNPLEALYKHYIIGQTFVFDEAGDESINFFAIRRKDEHPPFRNLYVSKGGPVLPTFGCVDMADLLRNIEKVHNARQAKIIAIK